MVRWVNEGSFLGGGFKDFLFSPLFGEDEPILTSIFQMGWNHQLDFHGIWDQILVTENTTKISFKWWFS